MAKKTNNLILVCPECGGTNVQSKACVDTNTSEFIESIENEEDWCNDCEEKTTVITLKEFKENGK